MNKQDRQAARQTAQDDPQYRAAMEARNAYGNRFQFEVDDMGGKREIYIRKSEGEQVWPAQLISADDPRYVESQRLFKVMVAARNAAEDRLAR